MSERYVMDSSISFQVSSEDQISTLVPFWRSLVCVVLVPSLLKDTVTPTVSTTALSPALISSLRPRPLRPRLLIVSSLFVRKTVVMSSGVENPVSLSSSTITWFGSIVIVAFLTSVRSMMLEMPSRTRKAILRPAFMRLQPWLEISNQLLDVCASLLDRSSFLLLIVFSGGLLWRSNIGDNIIDDGV